MRRGGRVLLAVLWLLVFRARAVRGAHRGRPTLADLALACEVQVLREKAEAEQRRLQAEAEAARRARAEEEAARQAKAEAERREKERQNLERWERLRREETRRSDQEREAKRQSDLAKLCGARD